MAIIMNIISKYLLCFLFLSCFSSDKKATDFSIKTHRGFIKTEQFRGEKLFIFFGFTRCPHICPTTLNQLHRLHLSNKDKNLKFSVLFISVDPNDSWQILNERMDSFPANFYAGTSEAKNLKQIMKQFNASYSITKTSGPDEESLIDHSSYIYVINSKGDWVESLPYDASLEHLNNVLTTADQKLALANPIRINRNIKKIAENVDCDLGKKAFCQVLDYKLTVSPKPVIQNKTFKFKLTSSQDILPRLEITGINKDMGRINAQLTKTAPNEFEGDFFLPFCEVSEMKWSIRIFNQKNHHLEAVDFFMSSQ